MTKPAQHADEQLDQQAHRPARDSRSPSTETEEDTRIVFTSWDCPIVPTRQLPL